VKPPAAAAGEDAFTASVNASDVLIITRRTPTSCGAANITLVGTGSNCKSLGAVAANLNPTATIVVPVTVLGQLGTSLVVNGDFKTVPPPGSPPGTIVGWESYTWQGSFTAARTAATSFDGKPGSAAVIMQGWAPGKFGLSQHLAMAPGVYDVSAMVAAQGVELGLFAQTFSFLIIVDDAPAAPGRTIGDIRIPFSCFVLFGVCVSPINYPMCTLAINQFISVHFPLCVVLDVCLAFFCF
jgi:hypothetical protein